MALAVVAGMAVPAGASITSPGANATLTGTASFSANGTGSATHCAIVNDTSSTVLQLVNSGGGVVDQSSNTTGFGSGSGASTSFNYETELSPNGNYSVKDAESHYDSSGFLGLGCSHNTTNFSENVTIANQSSTTYGGATSGAPGQSVSVSATIRESGGNNVEPPAGQTVTFTLSGGQTVSATTNASGVASTNLTVTGTPRAATITASYPAQWYAGSSGPATFTVTKDPSNVSVGTIPVAPVFGQPVTFTASVNSTAFGNNPNGIPSGTIQFQVNGSNVGSPVNLSGGSANLNNFVLGAVGPYTIGAIYSGDSNYSANSNSTTVTVSPAATELGLAANPSTTVFGQAVSFTATVASQPPGTGTPIGSVTFQVNGSPFSSVPVGPTGQATSSPISTLNADSYDITAIFQPGPDGDGNINYSGSQASITYAVGQASTTTTEVSSANPFAVFGQPIQFTSTVSATPPGAGTPTGTVDFQYEGVSPGSSSQGSFTDIGPANLVGGSATSSAVATLKPGFYNIKAVYSGDGNFLSSSTTSLDQDVTPDPTSTTLTSNANPSVFGQPVSVSASVSANAPGAGNPTGLVDFEIQSTAAGSTATDLGTVALAGGSATITLPNEPAGTYTVTAMYEGSPDADFFSSNTTLTQTVNPDPTTTTVTSSVNPSVFGQAVTFTATVGANAPGAGTPTGTVTFTDGSDVLGTEALSTSGGSDQASLTTGALSVATHAITATYNGDPNFVTSFGSLTQIVNPAQSSTTITPNSAVVQGESVTFTATVAAVGPGAGTPSGSVQFSVNGAPLGSPVALVNGSATSTAISNLSPGSYVASAAYSGDTNFLASSGSVGQNVAPDATTTSLDVSSTSALDTPITLTATVAPAAPGAGSPTGTVEFFDGANFVAEAALNQVPGADQAVATGVALSVGPHSLSAVYVGDFNFGSSTGAATWVVPAIGTTTSLTSSPNPSQFGAPVTLTATVNPANAGPALTGTVTYTDGSTTLGTAPVTLSGSTLSASLTVSGLAVGSHGIVASYSGDSSYSGSDSGTLNQTVTAAATSITAQTATSGGTVTAVLSTAQGPVAGQTLSFTAGTTSLCTAVTNAAGTATCTTGSLKNITLHAAGSYTVTYGGNGNYLSSTGTGKA